MPGEWSQLAPGRLKHKNINDFCLSWRYIGISNVFVGWNLIAKEIDSGMLNNEKKKHFNSGSLVKYNL